MSMEAAEDAPFPNEMRTIHDFQAFHRWLDEQKGFNTDIFLNMMLLSGEIGEVAQVLKKVYWMTEPQRAEEGQIKTLEEALAEQRENLGQELADCLAYILKLANYTGVDLQEAYLTKMAKNMQRSWKVARKEEA
jgi:NTP pyrophosphatase (non-canonical NTP hydrolase)